jgi:Rod binding domain-containing protein
VVNLSSIPLVTTTTSSSDQDKKIEKSSRDFEAILLGSWLQEAEHSFAKVPGTDEEEDDDDGTAQMQEGMAMQQLGESMAAAGGIGIAHMIARQLRNTSSNESDRSYAPVLNKSPQLPISRVMP